MCGRQRVLAVLAEPVAPLQEKTADEIVGRAGIAALYQVPARVAGQLAQGGAVGAGQVGGQHVRHQPRPLGPGCRIRRVAGIAGGQHRLGARAGGGGPGRGEPVTQDGLGEPVHLQPTVIDTGQRLPRHLRQGPPPGKRVRGPGGQLAGQDADRAGEQAFRDRLGRPGTRTCWPARPRPGPGGRAGPQSDRWRPSATAGKTPAPPGPAAAPRGSAAAPGTHRWPCQRRP